MSKKLNVAAATKQQYTTSIWFANIAKSCVANCNKSSTTHNTNVSVALTTFVLAAAVAAAIAIELKKF